MLKDIPLFEAHIHYTMSEKVDKSAAALKKLKALENFDKMLLLALPHGSAPNNVYPLQNLAGLYLKHALSPNAYAYGGLVHRFDQNDTAEGYRQQLIVCEKSGMDGMKMLEGKPYFRKNLARPLSHPVFDLYYGYAEQKGIPIVMHAADPENMWDYQRAGAYAIEHGWYCDESYPTKADITREVVEIMEKFPKLKMTLAHFFFIADDLDFAASLFDKYQNFCLDLTPGGEMFVAFNRSLSDTESFFKKYSKRIIFGSDAYDFPFEGKTDEEYKKMFVRTHAAEAFLTGEKNIKLYDLVFDGITLNRDELYSIFYGNAVRINGDPKPINYELCQTLARDMLSGESGLSETDKYNLRLITKEFSAAAEQGNR